MMESYLDLLVFFVVAAAAVMVWRAVSRHCPWARTPYAIYLISYGATTGIGAVAFGLGQGVVLDWIAYANATANLGVISVSNPLAFWLMIYGPFVIPGLTISLLSRANSNAVGVAPSFQRWFLSPVNFISYVTIVGVLCGFVLISFADIDMLDALSRTAAYQDDYASTIELRANLFGSMGMHVFAIIYVGIPTLSFVALHRAVITRSSVWIGAFVCVSGVAFAFQIMTIQKTIALIYFLSLLLAFYSLGVLRYSGIVLGVVIPIVTLTILQEFVSFGWSIEDTLALLTYRMSIGAIAYLNIFPNIAGYLGIDTMLDVLGIGNASNASRIVFDFLYPNVQFIQGNAPAAAHIMAYAEAGPIYGCFILIVVGAIIRFAGSLTRAAIYPSHGSILFALSIQSLVMIYYLTQVSVRDALMSGYGIIWAFIVVFPLLLLGVEDALEDVAP